MITPMLTRKVRLGQLLYELAAGSQNRSVHHKTRNKGEHEQVKRTKKYKEWKAEKEKKAKDK